MDYNFEEIRKYVKEYIWNRHSSKLHIAEDICQEVLIKVFKYKPTYWKSFSCKACDNLIIDDWRKSKRDNAMIKGYSRIRSKDVYEEYDVDFDETCTHIINMCPSFLKDRYLNGMSLVSMAKSRKKGVDTIKKELKRESTTIKKYVLKD